MAAPHFLSLTALPHGFDGLREESVKQGFTMLTRLASEWEAGTNRFDRPNELLLGAFLGNSSDSARVRSRRRAEERNRTSVDIEAAGACCRPLRCRPSLDRSGDSPLRQIGIRPD